MLSIGIDLGGTNIVASVVNEKYEILGTGKLPTATPRSADEIFDDIAQACKNAMAEAGVEISDISSVGMGTPGTVNGDGVIEFANNLGFNNVPARDMIRERLGDIPVYVDNDANCAALGEAYAGCGNGAKDFVAVTLGTGVGSGIIVDGKIVSGVNFAGGECGHMWRVMNQYMDTWNGPADWLEVPVSPITGTKFENAASTKMIHIIEFTADLIHHNKLKFDKSRNDDLVVTFHDSCNTSRGMDFCAISSPLSYLSINDNSPPWKSDFSRQARHVVCMPLFSFV